MFHKIKKKKLKKNDNWKACQLEGNQHIFHLNYLGLGNLSIF